MTTRKKLIEVALPLEAINVASAREKSIRHGHPSTLHLWWARRPLAACRAVIFASLVDDPDDPEAPAEFVEACRNLQYGTDPANDTPRQRLFKFIETLVQWESTTDEKVLNDARRLIQIATGGNPPPLLDPFAGGGSIPLEAQRLGLEAHASDLNPVAVMINKALIEIPPKFANMPPVNPRDRAGTAQGGSWKGAAGLATDVRYYGEWMREEAWSGLTEPVYDAAGEPVLNDDGTPEEKVIKPGIGHLYPTYNGETVIAWLWARTVKCPNPACGAMMPLVRTFDLSKKKGRKAWVEPQVAQKTREISFVVRTGEAGMGQEGTVNRLGATCVACGTPVPFDHIRAEGRAKRMSAQLMAIVTEGTGGRSYYAPTPEQEQVAHVAVPDNVPDTDLPEKALSFRVQVYGMTKHCDLFTPRQLVALTTFSDLVAEAREQIYANALVAGLPDDDIPLREDGTGARAYAEAVSVYLAFGVDKGANLWSTIASWMSDRGALRETFARQAIPMVWDYAEANPFSSSGGNILMYIERIADTLEFTPDSVRGFVSQQDATTRLDHPGVVIATDPPYYDNIGYADLSDYFYVWLRRSLRDLYPDVFGTLLVPKEPELIATPYRFGGNRKAAEEHFEHGLSNAFVAMRNTTSADYPLTVFYAFKQSESADDEEEEAGQVVSSTGWETMLEGLLSAGFNIDGTWPMRTEGSGRIIGLGANALASSIVLVCRPRPEAAPMTTRAEFIKLLRSELPAALRKVQSGNIAPVDLAQASIGPGMAVYSRYSKVLEPNGEQLTVRTALQIINQVLDEFLAEQEGHIDPETRFAVAWFEQHGFDAGAFGEADVLARAKNTSVDGLAHSGVLKAGAGKVQLYHWKELDPGWDPASDRRLTTWEATHHLIEQLNTHGEQGAAILLARMPPDLAAEARQLAYRLYSICERKGWADIARDYNALVISWGQAQQSAAEYREQYQQGKLF